jgi:ribonucleoside-diphosphate reductase alpha chain
MAIEQKEAQTSLVEPVLPGRKSGWVSAVRQKGKTGLTINRVYTRAGVHPFDEVKWVKRTALISGEDGKAVFEEKDLEFPDFWSQTAVNVVASKYFRVINGVREKSVKSLISRVVSNLAKWGREMGYFATEEDCDAFEAELTYILLHQHGSFNSPVWFNCGVYPDPQLSACFILSVEDTMESILNLVYNEGMIFKGGSGAGSNFSKLRSSKERLSGGGIASGPLSFIKVLDASAGVIKSGGTTRRAAKMVILNIDHPDIEEFIKSKAEEEKKAWVLIDHGYDGSLDGEAYATVAFQNANHSVRVTDEFMKAVLEDGDWKTISRTTGEVIGSFKARDLMKMIAEAAWACGDPGIQFDTTINKWHTCKNSGRINASNPCSEYMFLDDSACNLASINLMKYRKPDGTFDIDNFKHTVDIFITAQEIIVDNASYPTKKIAENSHLFRPLGLGYANLGALLMSLGIPYDSDEGRALAAAITALMTGRAYAQSARIAKAAEAFPRFSENREAMLEVIDMHRAAAYKIPALTSPALLTAAQEAWDEAFNLGSEWGFANAQVTVLAPTGTIAFMMDCDTTGIEPDLSLVKIKKLVGGGTMEIVNTSVPLALRTLGYNEDQIAEITAYIKNKGTIENAPDVPEAHYAVFDTSFKPLNGQRFIHYLGHIKMQAAVQPFISGSISKTVNLPNEITVDEIENIYIEAWKQGLKCIALYRDGCKRIQPLSVKGSKDKLPEPVRRRLPDERTSITHKFEVGGHEGILTAGAYEDGKLGELFLMIHKEGSVVSGLANCLSIAVSLALQYGVPLEAFVEKFAFQKFEPSGWTKNAQIRMAHSIVDYVFRYLALKFLPPAEAAKYISGLKVEKAEISKEDKEKNAEISAPRTVEMATESEPTVEATVEVRPRQGGGGIEKMVVTQSDAPVCDYCGSLMVRNGSCYLCLNCYKTTGSCS